MKKFLSIAIFLLVTALYAAEEGNVLIYTDPVQISSEISPYESLAEGKPVTGTIMVTHDANLKIDENSFRMGNEAIKVKLVNQVQLSPSSKLVITIYQFEISGRNSGAYTLPPITVKVGGEEYQAPPLPLVIGE